MEEINIYTVVDLIEKCIAIEQLGCNFYLNNFGFCMARENKNGILVLYNKHCYNEYCYNNNIYICSIDEYNDDWSQDGSDIYDIKWIKQCASETELIYCFLHETYYPPVDWENSNLT